MKPSEPISGQDRLSAPGDPEDKARAGDAVTGDTTQARPAPPLAREEDRTGVLKGHRGILHESDTPAAAVGPSAPRDTGRLARPKPRSSLFVERQTYRRRRLADSARALPVLGLGLWFVPLVWTGNADGVRATSAMIYIFVIWFTLVALSAGILAAMRRAERRSAADAASPDSAAGLPDGSLRAGEAR